jgi:hypothetical protein
MMSLIWPRDAIVIGDDLMHGSPCGVGVVGRQSGDDGVDPAARFASDTLEPAG